MAKDKVDLIPWSSRFTYQVNVKDVAIRFFSQFVGQVNPLLIFSINHYFVLLDISLIKLVGSMQLDIQNHLYMTPIRSNKLGYQVDTRMDQEASFGSRRLRASWIISRFPIEQEPDNPDEFLLCSEQNGRGKHALEKLCAHAFVKARNALVADHLQDRIVCPWISDLWQMSMSKSLIVVACIKHSMRQLSGLSKVFAPSAYPDSELVDTKKKHFPCPTHVLDSHKQRVRERHQKIEENLCNDVYCLQWRLVSLEALTANWQDTVIRYNSQRTLLRTSHLTNLQNKERISHEGGAKFGQCSKKKDLPHRPEGSECKNSGISSISNYSENLDKQTSNTVTPLLPAIDRLFFNFFSILSYSMNCIEGLLTFSWQQENN